MNTDRVGRVVGWQPVTVARKLKTGAIPGGVKCGTRWMLPAEKLELFLASLRGNECP
jgi:hypothetical protein